MFEYFYVNESERFAFYRIPKVLFTDNTFKALSAEAKILYGLMLDRISLSAKNKWVDELGRVYIYFRQGEIKEMLNCASQKAAKLISELDTENGIGLIEIVNQGMGNPRRIYVKNFINMASNPHEQQTFENQTTGRLKIKQPDIRKSNSQTFENQTHGRLKIEQPDIRKSNALYMKNDTDKNKTNLSINPSKDRIDRSISQIHHQISYAELVEYSPALKDSIDNIVLLIADVNTTSQPQLTIAQEPRGIAHVRERFRLLTRDHVLYVIDKVRGSGTKIRNMRAYLLAALYHAPTTEGIHFQQDLQLKMQLIQDNKRA